MGKETFFSTNLVYHSIDSCACSKQAAAISKICKQPFSFDNSVPAAANATRHLFLIHDAVDEMRRGAGPQRWLSFAQVSRFLHAQPAAICSESSTCRAAER